MPQRCKEEAAEVAEDYIQPKESASSFSQWDFSITSGQWGLIREDMACVCVWGVSPILPNGGKSDFAPINSGDLRSTWPGVRISNSYQ